MKKLLLIKLGTIALFFSFFFFLVIAIISALGFSIASEQLRRSLEDVRKDSYVLNNNLYASQYRTILTDYLFDYGYVSLERLVWYLQTTNNVVNINELPITTWREAYKSNADKELLQMIPTSDMCAKTKANLYKPFQPITPNDNLYNPSLNNNDDKYYKIDLCDNKFVEEHNSIYTSTYLELPYAFPLKRENFGSVTSMVNEIRNVNLDLSEQELSHTNFHSGWDFSASAETPVYSICDGTVEAISFTQNSNVPFNDQPEPKNKTGNFIKVKCDSTNDIVSYFHLYPNSASNKIKTNSKVSKGQFLARVGTTGESTGNHLHLGLNADTGTRLDALYFIDFSFTNYKD